jgi:hypothetical protein
MPLERKLLDKIELIKQEIKQVRQDISTSNVFLYGNLLMNVSHMCMTWLPKE